MKKRICSILGRGLDYAVALEGSLKLKGNFIYSFRSICWWRIKAWPIALIEDGTSSYLLTQEALIEKMVSNISEVKTRGAKVIGIAYEGIKR